VGSDNPRHARVGAVVLSYRTGPALADTLQSLDDASPGVDALLVVDNASGDDTIPSLLQRMPDVEVMQLDENVGYAAAMNRGAEVLTARGQELLLFLTHETVVTPDLVGRLRHRMAVRQDLAAVGPLLGRVSEPAIVWSAGGRLTHLRRAGRHRGSGAAMAGWVDGEPREVGWLDGACVMVRADAFAAVGGYREDLFLYWEDVDLCRRLHRAGYAVECVPAAVAYQEPSMAPPYLDARNRALVLGAAGVAATACDLLVHAIADPLRGRGLDRVRLGAHGLRDAVAGRLDRDLATRRPT
jgi:N-acetylglucosaminyl-diphospho-decaprenol L-rhamnosyltransferase